MSAQMGLVLDANILVRAVFGKNVRRRLESCDEGFLFCCPEMCLKETLKHIPIIADRRNFDVDVAFRNLKEIALLIESVEDSAYSAFREPAMQRIARRDPDDWPVVAVSLMLQLPIWTEDLDFFGIGIATWKSELVELYFQS